LFFRFIQSDDKTDSYAVRQIGNVTDDTEITFEYGIRTNTNQSTPDLPPTKTEGKQGTPFQCVRMSSLSTHIQIIIISTTTDKHLDRTFYMILFQTGTRELDITL
jgi:hypothetical protein